MTLSPQPGLLKKHKLNFQIFEDIFKGEHNRCNYDFHLSEFQSHRKKKPDGVDVAAIEMKVKKELVSRGETNPLKRQQNMKLIKTEPPRYKKLQLERFCGDPVAFYIYKRKNLFLDEKIAVQNDQALIERRKKAIQKEEQRKERERKETEQKARLEEALNRFKGAPLSQSRVGSPTSMSGIQSMDGRSALSHFAKKRRNETGLSYQSNPLSQQTPVPQPLGPPCERPMPSQTPPPDLSTHRKHNSLREGRKVAWQAFGRPSSVASSMRPVLIQDISHNEEEGALDPFSPSFDNRLIIKQKVKRLPPRLPNSIKCKQREEKKLNQILQGCDYALFADRFRLDQLRQKQRYTKALNQNFDKALHIMKEFDYADGEMLETLYNYRAEDLEIIKQQERQVTNEFRVSSQETTRLLSQMNSKMMREKNRKKKF